MTSKKNALGKGLSALLENSNTDITTEANQTNPNINKTKILKSLELDKLSL